MIESIYLLEVCLLLLILSVALLCWQIGRLLESLDNVYRREEILYRIRTGGMIDFNRQIKPKRRDRLRKMAECVVGAVCAIVMKGCVL
jgi:hypothetical protein